MARKFVKHIWVKITSIGVLMAKMRKFSIIQVLQLSERLKLKTWRQFQNHIQYAPNFNFPFSFGAFDQCWISILFLLKKFKINFEKLAISLVLISQGAVKAWIIGNWYIFAIDIDLLLISKIFLSKYLSRIFFTQSEPFIISRLNWLIVDCRDILPHSA